MIKPNVILNEYTIEWERQFEYEKNRIMAAIGNQIDGIEHIGSTSIRGLMAKPIIDIMVGVRSLERTSAFVKPLSEVDYEYVPKPEVTERKFFRKGLWGNGTCHLHICVIHSTEWIEKTVFRDYLRKHPESVEEYALLKCKLAIKYKYDRPAYTKQKEPFIKNIIKHARIEFQR